MSEDKIDTEELNEDWEEDEEDLTLDEVLAKYVQSLPNWKQYVGRMYQGGGLFFSICSDGDIIASSDTFTYGLGCCHSPSLYTGITKEEGHYLDGMMERLGFNETFFDEAVSCGYCDHAGEVESYYEDADGDEKRREIYQAMKQEVESGNTPFKSMNHFISAVTRYDVDDDIYYMWEGSACSLSETYAYDSVSLVESGLDEDDWIAMLNDLDDCNVEVDNEYFVRKGRQY